MSTKISDLQAELAALQAQRNAIDVPALQTAVEAAQVAFDAHTPDHHAMVDHTEMQLSVAVRTARDVLREGTHQARLLDHQIQPLAAMVSAPDRLTALTDDAEVMSARVLTARVQVATAQSTYNTLAGVLADVSATHTQETEAAARDLLSAAKSGKASKVVAPDRGQVDATEAALAMASAELVAAQAAHAAEVAAHAHAHATAQQAQADVAALVFELAERDYIAAVVKYRNASGSGFEPDLMQRVWAAESEAA